MILWINMTLFVQLQLCLVQQHTKETALIKTIQVTKANGFNFSAVVSHSGQWKQFSTSLTLRHTEFLKFLSPTNTLYIQSYVFWHFCWHHTHEAFTARLNGQISAKTAWRVFRNVSVLWCLSQLAASEVIQIRSHLSPFEASCLKHGGEIFCFYLSCK